MKKLLTAVLLCAMLITTLASCAAGTQNTILNLYAAPQKNSTSELAYSGTHETAFKTELTDADVWNGTNPTDDEVTAWYNTLSENTISIDTAKELVAFAIKLNAQTTEIKYFDGVTVNLTKDIDLGGYEWIQISTATANYFKGTFNGNNHAIGNFKMTLTAKGSNGWGFFGALGGEAKIMNLSLINGTIYNGTTTSVNIDKVGSLVASIAPDAGKTVTISNVFSNVNFATATNTTTGKIYYSGGLIGEIHNGTGNVLISNAKYAGDMNIPLNAPDCIGAMIGRIQKGNNITIQNCYIDSSIDSGLGKNASGLIARVATNALSGTLSIANCDINVKINIDSDVGNDSYIEKSGGLIGQVDKAPANGIMIEGCTVRGEMNFGAYSGGVIGALNEATKFQIINTTFDGTLATNRNSGGFVGYVKMTGTDNKIENCSIGVNAILNLTSYQDTAGEVGGFIGRVASDGTLTLTNPQMLGTLNATLKTAATSGTDCAAALIGKIDAASAVVNVTEPIITGTLNFKNESTTDAKESIAVLCAGVKDNTVQFNYTTSPVWYDPASVSVPEGMTLYMCGFTANPTQNTVVGYQTRKNGDTAYDLRYVVALNLAYETDYDYVGIEVEIQYGESETKTFTAYIEKLYTSVNGDGNTYTAASLGGKYLYTVVIEGIPNDINVEDATMKVTLKPFTVKGTGDSAVTTVGTTATHGSVATAE